MKRNPKEEEKTKLREYNMHLDNVTFFPGSILEYENHVGYAIRIVDIGDRKMGVGFMSQGGYEHCSWYCAESLQIIEMLVAQKTEAIVNCNLAMKSYGEYMIFGLPISRQF